MSVATEQNENTSRDLESQKGDKKILEPTKTSQDKKTKSKGHDQQDKPAAYRMGKTNKQTKPYLTAEIQNQV